MHEIGEEESKPVEFKVILLGDAYVGKTCIIKRYTCDEFYDTFSTIGTDIYKKRETNCDPIVQLVIRDTAGQEKHSGLTRTFTRDANAFVIVYSIDEQNSFDSIEKWHSIITETCVTENYLLYLVENKIDLREDEDENKNKKYIPQGKGQEKAQELGIKFASVSAKTPQNIAELFYQIACDCLATFYIVEGSQEKYKPPEENVQGNKCNC